jgi:chitin disaccharide deacetylase
MSRRIWLCADDYGISPGVNRAIRDLIENGRLNATSAIVLGPATGRDEVNALKESARANPACAIGLHVTLTAPFRPLTMHYRPLQGGLFLSHTALLRRGLMGRLDQELIYTEVMEQLAAFADLFGRAPDFVDGHQHAQLFPGVRTAFVAAVKQAAPEAWIRQCGRDRPWTQRLDSPKALVLDILSTQLRTRAARAKLAFNPAFAGAYDFSKAADFGALMREFLQGMPEGGVVMCHPGFVDDVLVSLDPLTLQREREYEFLRSEAFPPLLTASEITLG